jgi:hypothetical protein
MKQDIEKKKKKNFIYYYNNIYESEWPLNKNKYVSASVVALVHNFKQPINNKKKHNLILLLCYILTSSTNNNINKKS